MSTALAVQQQEQSVAEYSDGQVGLLKRMVCPPGTTDDELNFFLTYAKRTKLDPFARQIYCMKRGNKFTVESTIDGFRICAERTGEYEGQEDPVWCGADGAWEAVWLKDDPPTACRVGVFRKGWRQPLRAVALFEAYKQTYWDNQAKSFKLGPQWEKNGANMLAKCAEALALRKAFPRELSGLYSSDEMAQAGNPPTDQGIDYEGSREKQQAVAQEKIAQLKAAQAAAAELPASTGTEKPPFDFKNMIENFQKIHAELVALGGQKYGDKSYYDILGRYGYEHANEFKSAADAKAAFKDMLAVKKTWLKKPPPKEQEPFKATAADLKEPFRATDADLPEGLFPDDEGAA